MLDTIIKENLEEVDTTTLESLTMIISKLSIINDNIIKLRSEFLIASSLCFKIMSPLLGCLKKLKSKSVYLDISTPVQIWFYFS